VDRVLRIPRGNLISRYLRLSLAFFSSALIHSIAEMQMPLDPWQRGQFLFFSSQAGIIMFEDAVKALYRRVGAPLPRIVERIIGYAWVASWMYVVAPYWAYSSVTFAESRPSQLMPLIVDFLKSNGVAISS
jgi:hypothetical protein